MKTKLTFNDSIDPDSPLGITLSNEAAGSMAGRTPTPAGSVRQTPISETAKELASEFHQVFVLGGNPFNRTGKRPLIGLIQSERARKIQDAIDAENALLLTANARLRAALEAMIKTRLDNMSSDFLAAVNDGLHDHPGFTYSDEDEIIAIRQAREALSGDPRP